MSGSLGNGGNSASAVPVLVSGGHTFTQLAAGNGFTCGILQGGSARCWGEHG